VSHNGKGKGQFSTRNAHGQGTFVVHFASAKVSAS